MDAIAPETPAQFSVRITDYKMNQDGTMTVYGPITTETIDAVNDIVDADWAAKALDEWLTDEDHLGNMRTQHIPKWASGRGVEVEREGKVHKLKATAVDPLTQKLIQNRILKAFSVGIVGTKRTWDTVKHAWRVVGGKLEECSFVDVPCNPDTDFAVVKSLVKEENGALKAIDLFSRVDPLTLAEVLTTEELIDLAGKFDLDVTHPRVRQALDLANKVDNDPDVGGGVDRDKIPAEDFAGPNRSFPIVTPQDVADAASSLGRAGSDDMSDSEKAALRARIKKNIIAIAKRKGAKYVAKLPDAWKEDSQKAVNVEDTEDEVTDEKAKKPAPADDAAEDQDDEAEEDDTEDGDEKVAPVVEVPDEVVTSIKAVVDRLHTATCPTYSTEAVQKLEPGTWSERLSLGDLEEKLAEHTAKSRDEGPSAAWFALTEFVGKMAAPVMVSRYVGDELLDEAHSELVAAQRAEKAALVQNGTEAEGPQGGRSARQFYTTQAAARHADQLKSIHDACVQLRPDICPLPGPSPVGAPVGAQTHSTAGSGSVAGNDVNGSRTTKSAISVVDAGAAVAAEPSAVDNTEEDGDNKVTQTLTAPVDVDAVIKEMAETFQARYDAKAAEMQAAHEAQIKSLQDQITKLDADLSRPNPMEAPLRKALMKFAPERVAVDDGERQQRIAVMERMAADSSNPERQMAAQKALHDLDKTS